jgi:hypothetical protein
VAIEFLDPPEYAPLPEAPVEAIGGEERRRRARWLHPELHPDLRALVGALFLTGAAVLPVAAPFARVYVETVRTRLSNDGFAVDGWGRAHRTLGSALSFPPGTHEDRYGIVLCCCAGAFVLAALVVLGAGFWRGTRRALAGAASATLGVSGVLAGVTAAMWLGVRARADSLRASTKQDAAQFGHLKTDVALGSGFWLAAAAVVAGLLAAFACWWLSVRDRNPV